MFARLFAKGSPQPAGPPRIADGSRVYAVGDIHGRADLLRAINRMIREDAAAAPTARKIVVYLGDYVDRGDASCAVIDCLIDEKLPGFEHVHLLGNHEDSMLRFLGDLQIGPAWLAYGGAATLRSYGVVPPSSDRGLARVQSELRDKLPQRHLDFLRRLPLSHVEGDYCFVHAGMRPGVALDAQAPQDLLWIRDEFLDSTADFGKIVVHGHSITDEPDVQLNRIGIDTGAYASGRLTCLALAGAERKFLRT